MDIQRIAGLLKDSPHRPDHPSYRAFCDEIACQYRTLEALGWAFEPANVEPYPTSWGMFNDMDKQILWVYTGGSVFAPSHPLGEVLPGVEDPRETYNFAFRAVHDVLGHYTTRTPFETFEGEIQAYRNHARTMSPEAQSALFWETVGQTCYFHTFGEFPSPQRAVVEPWEGLI